MTMFSFYLPRPIVNRGNRAYALKNNKLGRLMTGSHTKHDHTAAHSVGQVHGLKVRSAGVCVCWEVAETGLRTKMIRFLMLKQGKVGNKFFFKIIKSRGPSRWWRSKRWRSPSSPQIRLHVEQLLQNTY